MLLVEQVPHHVSTLWGIGMVNDAENIIFISVGLFGVLFNIYQTLAVYKYLSKNFRTRQFNSKVSIPRLMLLLNLSISDLIICTSSLLMVLMTYLQVRGLVVKTLQCQLFPMLQYTSALASSISITAIAVDRYVTIVGIGAQRYSPQTVSSKKYQGLTLVFFIWLGAFIFITPLVIFQHSYQDICVSEWPNQNYKAAYSFTFIMIQYVIPLCLLIIVHTRICRFLHKQQIGRFTLPHQTARRRRTNYMLVAAIITFMLTWFPLTLLTALTEISDILNSIKQSNSAFSSCQIIALLSTWYNPLLYGWFNTKIRRELLALKPTCSACQSNNNRTLNTAVVPQVQNSATVSALLPHRSHVLIVVVYTSGCSLIATQLPPHNELLTTRAVL